MCTHSHLRRREKLTCLYLASVPVGLCYPHSNLPTKNVPENFREGAPPGTAFRNSDNGWIKGALYLQFSIATIQSARPVLLIQDGHSSHLSIDLVELASANDIHVLCLPSHNTHILQPLDVSSFKLHFSKSHRVYTAKVPGRVFTGEVLASLIGEAWSQFLTAVNIVIGLRKCSIHVYPLYHGQICDRLNFGVSQFYLKAREDKQCQCSWCLKPLLSQPRKRNSIKHNTRKSTMFLTCMGTSHYSPHLLISRL